VKLGVAAVAIAAVAPTGCGSSQHPSNAIAYTKFLRGGGEAVWIAAPDGSHKRRLARGGSPQLSPDGHWVALRKPCGRYGDCLFVVASGGGKPRLLARNAFPGPWSSNGRRILAYRAVSEVNGRLLVVARDGGRPLAVAYGNLVGWSFSPDGMEVAYALQRGAHADVFVVPAGGGTPRRVTNDGRSSSPVWTAKGISSHWRSSGDASLMMAGAQARSGSSILTAATCTRSVGSFLLESSGLESRG
jgi:hypothetical protein